MSVEDIDTDASIKSKIFVFIVLTALIAFTVTAIVEDHTLTGVQKKSHALKSFNALCFVALIAFVVAFVLNAVIFCTTKFNLMKITLITIIAIGCACCIVAVTMYYEHIKYARRLDSSGWLLTAILASFQLCLFVFMFIFF
ncbi:hypothetical protein KSF78_0002754 [Schistosoma japonicum]|uniref:SJCHGC04269 protein n=1 Tax=Schistosoma japonicum TaxID=6182 RepID=Q5DF22_SCHJA|nr:SJCHGC04269 protein [Schistosoma japonicum]KAH8863620.1 hypothetical protein KSF78_0002754 [Schistosoma japonicum]